MIHSSFAADVFRTFASKAPLGSSRVALRLLRPSWLSRLLPTLAFPWSGNLSTPRAWLWPRLFAGTPAADAVLDLMFREADARANLVWSATLQVEDIGQTVQRELEGLPILPAISVDIQ